MNNSDRPDLWQHVVVLDSSLFMIPHVSMAEGEFVLRPLWNITKELRHPLDHVTVHQLYQQLLPQKTQTNAQNDHHNTSTPTAAAASTAADGGAVRVFPLPRGRCL